MIDGKYKIRVDKEDFIKIINICKSKDITIEKSSNKKDKIYFYIQKNDIKKFKKILEKYKLNNEVISTKGIYFVFEYLIKRWIFTLLIFTLFILIYLSSCLIWKIDIQGEKYIKEDEILNFLKEEKVEVGNLIIGIDTEILNNNLRIKFPNIAFSAIDIKGTNIIFRIIDYDMNKNLNSTALLIEDIKHSDIVASDNSLIEKIIVSSGTALVKPKMFVKKDNILIEGKVIENKDTELRQNKYVRAKGKVIGKVVYDIDAKKELKKQIKYFTGNKKYEVIKKNGEYIFKYKNNFKNAVKKTKSYNLLGNRSTINIYEEYIIKEEPLDEESAKLLIEKEIEKQIKDKGVKIYNIELLDKKEYIDNNILYITEKLVITQDIGKERIE